MKTHPAIARYCILLFFSLVVQLSYAQNAMGFDARSMGLSGAVTALPEYSIYGNNNPGGQVFLGNKFSLGLELSAPKSSYSVTGEPTPFEATLQSLWPLGLEPGSFKSNSKINFIPTLSLNLRIDDINSMGISIYGNGNQGASFDNKVYYSPVISDFGSSQGFINPMGTITTPSFIKFTQYFAAITWSHKFGENLGVGLSAVGAWQSIDVGGLEAFGTLNYSVYPQNVSTNSTDNSFGIGGKLGVQWLIHEQLMLGVTFRSKLYMTPFNSYKGLIAQNGSMDIPSEWSLGAAYQPTKRILITADVNRFCWSGVDAWGKSFNANELNELGGENGAGFGRKDQMSYKLGLQYKIPKWQFRAGYQYRNQVVQNQELLLNILLPQVVQHYVSLGLSRQLGKQTLNFAVVKGLKNTVEGTNALDNAQILEVSAETLSIAVSVDF